jgi:hypothetical protein
MTPPIARRPSRRRGTSLVAAIAAVAAAALFAAACGEAVDGPPGSQPNGVAVTPAEPPAGQPDRSPHDGECGAGEWRYDDTENDAIDGSAGNPIEVGDGRCYTRCNGDADCGGNGLTCQSLGLNDGSDFNCANAIWICAAPQTLGLCPYVEAPTAAAGEECHMHTDCLAPRLCTDGTCQ